MTEWTDLTDEGLLPGKPATSAQGLAFRDNPVAIAEGAENAPKVQGQALDIYKGSYLLDGSGSPTITDLDRAAILRVHGVVTGSGSGSGNATIIQAALSNDNGSTWGSWFSISYNSYDSEGVSFETIIDLVNGERFLTGFFLGATYDFSGSITSITVPSGVNAIQFRRNGGTPADSYLGVTVMGGVSP